MMNKIDLNNLEKQLTEATDNLKALQSYFDELSIKYEAVRDSVPKQCNDIIK